MKIAFIIRFHYKIDDPRFEWRFNYFKDFVLPMIKNQTVKDFDICVRCNEWHKKLFENLGLKTFTVENESVKYKRNGRFRYFHDFVNWERVLGLEKYDIQMGLDSDDLIEKNYVEKICWEVEKFIKEYPGKSLHLSFQPQTLNIRNGKKIIGELHRYRPTKGSAFMALYQPNKENYKFIYCESHITLWRHADKSITLPKGYCYASIHHLNESTGK
jgi:hypothetical protein